MRQRLGFLFVSLFVGFRLSLEEALCEDVQNGGYSPTISFCYNPNSGQTCFKAFSAVDLPFKAGIPLCSPPVPGLNLTVINYSQGTVEIFIGIQLLQLANDTIIMDAQRISANVSLDSSWVNGHTSFQEENGGTSKRSTGGLNNYPFFGGACVDSENGQLPVANCVDYVESQVRYRCEFSDDAPTHTDDSDESSIRHIRQCICTRPQCWTKDDVGKAEHDGKWWSCNCTKGYVIVCHEEEEITTRTVVDATDDSDVTLTSISADLNSSPINPELTGKTDSTSSATQNPTIRASDDSIAAFASSPQSTVQNITLLTTTIWKIENTKSTSSMNHEQRIHSAPATSLDTTSILLILLLLVAVAFIVVIVIFIIRRRKYDRRYDASSMKNTNRNEPVSSQSASVAPASRPSDGTIPSDNNVYVDVEMTQRPPPFNSTTYAGVQPTSQAVDMGKSVDYVDIDFPKKDQQYPRNAVKITACISPIYSEPFEPPTSDSNTEYAEPFKPDQRPNANAPVLSHNADGDQQDIYSLATAIPLGDPNVIYSEPNKPAKSATPKATGGAVNTTDSTYLEAIEVKHGAGSGLDAKLDPSAVYAEPIKLKKSA